MKQIQLVVFNEHTLGYILPEMPKYVCVLHQSILKGAPFNLHPDSNYISPSDKIRLATEQDFNDYRVSVEGFNNDPETYLIKKS